MNDIVCVLPEPDAAFSVNHQVASLSDPSFQFLNGSLNASTYQWQFGDGGTSTQFSPNHTYAETADNYTVMLVATNAGGCRDTARMTVEVIEELIFFIPNAFTPDGNEFNNTFQPVFTSGFDPFSFSMVIYNRWGEPLFETKDATIGWDGTYAGKLAPQGAYTWTVHFRDIKNDKKYEYAGHLMLIQ